MKIAVLNYSTSEVDIIEVDIEKYADAYKDDIEALLSDKCGYHLSEISWMVSDNNDISINFEHISDEKAN